MLILYHSSLADEAFLTFLLVVSGLLNVHVYH